MEKQESNKALSNFPTATTATNYYQLWGTDSEGKARGILIIQDIDTGKREREHLLELARELSAVASGTTHTFHDNAASK